jgi:hypothetical protein
MYMHSCVPVFARLLSRRKTNVYDRSMRLKMMESVVVEAVRYVEDE